MKFSENWLRELVAIPADREELAARLTMSGLEVEEISAAAADLDRVVVAEIISAEPHPQADRLKLCQVNVGADAPIQIVCGAPNARVGLKAPLAMVGAVLPGGMEIKASQLRGVDSIGMLCSAKELGLDADASGLYELRTDAPAGQALADYLGLPDAVIELGLTPNRADCLGMHGLAREVAAEFGVAWQAPVINPVAATHHQRIAITLEAAADCPRYCGRLIRGLAAHAPSPLWLTERLRRAGLRSRGALVDVTNYVMLETGQPLHAFDAANIDAGIVVRRARAAETLKLLDEREIALDESFLVIADASKTLALAGIMGGFDSRVSITTQHVFLESAHFAPTAISGRARRLGLHTDASHRFERGVDPELPRRALERATALLLEIAGGSAGEVVCAQSVADLPRRATVGLRRSRLQRVLGVAVEDTEVARILTSLGMEVSETPDGWQAMPPSARFDIAIEEDLIEEVARIHGYGNIPARVPRGEIAPAVISETQVGISNLREQMVARGYCEAITYSFVNAELLETWGVQDGAISLANPLSAELAVMRTQLLPGLVSALVENCKHQQSRVRLFEVGRSYRSIAGAPVETDRIAAVATGNAQYEQWGERERALDFYDLKGDLESILALNGLSADEFRFQAGGPAWLHGGRAATVLRGDVVVGVMGALDPRLQAQLDVIDDVYVFELDLPALRAREVPAAKELSRFPSLRRDIAIVVTEQVSWREIEDCVRKAVGPRLVELFLFDRFAASSVGEGVKSLAMGLILQDDSRTLTDQDADDCVAAAVSALSAGYKSKLRG